MPIGVGVPIQKEEDSSSSSLESQLRNITGIEEARKSELKSPDKFEWSDKPFLKGQFQDQESWKYGEIAVKLFDLSKAEDLKEYSNISATSFQEDPCIVILDEQKQFCQNAENWKVLIQFAKIKYKRFLNEEGN
jgi:hypothetical protein